MISKTNSNCLHSWVRLVSWKKLTLVFQYQNPTNHPVSSCCYMDICIYLSKLASYCGLCWCCPQKVPSSFLPTWRLFFRQGLQAALHHLRMGCVCSTWNLLVYLTGQTFFPVKKWVQKNLHLNSTAFCFIFNPFRLRKPAVFFGASLVIHSCCPWIQVKILCFGADKKPSFLPSHFVSRKKCIIKLQQKPIIPPIRGSWTV